MPTPSEDQAGAEIEITPEMIEPGACEVALHSPESTNNQATAFDFYLPMEEVQRSLT